MTDTDIIKACGEVCTDNRFELIAKYKQLLIDSTNIETAHGEMAVIDSILFRCWQMGWLDKLEEHNRQKAEIERLQEYYKLYFERERTIKELQENIEHLQNKIVMYEKEIKRSAWDLPPMGGFHDDR